MSLSSKICFHIMISTMKLFLISFGDQVTWLWKTKGTLGGVTPSSKASKIKLVIEGTGPMANYNQYRQNWSAFPRLRNWVQKFNRTCLSTFPPGSHLFVRESTKYQSPAWIFPDDFLFNEDCGSITFNLHRTRGSSLFYTSVSPFSKMKSGLVQPSDLV